MPETVNSSEASVSYGPIFSWNVKTEEVMYAMNIDHVFLLLRRRIVFNIILLMLQNNR